MIPSLGPLRRLLPAQGSPSPHLALSPAPVPVPAQPGAPSRHPSAPSPAPLHIALPLDPGTRLEAAPEAPSSLYYLRSGSRSRMSSPSSQRQGYTHHSAEPRVPAHWGPTSGLTSEPGRSGRDPGWRPRPRNSIHNPAGGRGVKAVSSLGSMGSKGPGAAQTHGA